MTRPNFNLAAVEAATPGAIAAGHRILQTHRYGKTDEEHVGFLLRYLLPLPPEPLILDAGCGIGEVSRLMSKRLPLAAFILGNISTFQLDMVDPAEKMLIPTPMDCHEMPLVAGCVDAVMFSSAMCHMDAPVVLAEAARVTKPGGVLLVNEMTRMKPGNALLEEHIAGRVLLISDMVKAIKGAGYRIDRVDIPQADDSAFRAMLREMNLEAGLEGVVPCIIRAVLDAA